MPPKQSKSEKRLEKLIQKIEKNKPNNVKLASGITPSSKSIRVDWKPELVKNPRLITPIDNYRNTYFSWCISHADRDGHWSWGEPRNWIDEEYTNEIENHFQNLSNNTWNEIENQKYNGAHNFQKLLNKYQPLDSICDEAQLRWQNDPDLAQFDQLFRFRRGTYKRIWGVRIMHHFYTVWYERNHRICPIEHD
jgi:hypothetical protein